LKQRFFKAHDGAIDTTDFGQDVALRRSAILPQKGLDLLHGLLAFRDGRHVAVLQSAAVGEFMEESTTSTRAGESLVKPLTPGAQNKNFHKTSFVRLAR
jgi:hypothetical protein